MSHAERLEWDRGGRCRYRVMKQRTCTGPAWSDKCLGRDTDEYGTTHWCPECTYGSGIQTYWTLVRVPEFDAPRPKKDWEPDWVETRVSRVRD